MNCRNERSVYRESEPGPTFRRPGEQLNVHPRFREKNPTSRVRLDSPVHHPQGEWLRVRWAVDSGDEVSLLGQDLMLVDPDSGKLARVVTFVEPL